jgi:hypothetical protein
LSCLCACSWFGARRSRPPSDPSEIIVTGAPRGSLVFIDGSQVGEGAAHDDQSQVLDVTPGTHKVEIHANDRVVYREDTYVGPGDRRLVTVLSGISR